MHLNHRLMIFAALSALPLAGSPAFAQGPNIFVADQEACFGRVYDRTHLASHPRQKVTGIHIWRALSERQDAENWRPNQRAEAIKSFREDGYANVEAFVTFTDRRGLFRNSLSCRKGDDNRTRCSIDCDGGSFTLEPERGGTVLLRNDGFVLVGGCGEEVEEGQSIFFSPGADDKVFRLTRMPAATCLAEANKARPIRKGTPLRARFKEDEAFCLGRDYDTAHLAKSPQQKVTAIRVGRLDPAAEKADEPDEYWVDRIKLSVTLSTRRGGKNETARYRCRPLDASWECEREAADGAALACRARVVHLARTEGDDVLLVNRRSGLLIDEDCEKSARPESDQYPRHPATASDDKVFRLTHMPVEACR